MLEYSLNREPLLRLLHQKPRDQIHALVREKVREAVISSENGIVEVLEIVSSERERPADHYVEEYSQGPEIRVVAFVSLIADDLWCDVGGCTTLLTNVFSLFDKATYPEVADLNSEILIKQDVI